MIKADDIIGELDPDLFKCECCEKWFKQKELTNLYLGSNGKFSYICRLGCMPLASDIDLEYHWETIATMKKKLKEKVFNDKG